MTPSLVNGFVLVMGSGRMLEWLYPAPVWLDLACKGGMVSGMVLCVDHLVRRPSGSETQEEDDLGKLRREVEALRGKVAALRSRQEGA